MRRILIKNARLVDEKGIRKSDLLIEGEKIAAEKKRGAFESQELKGEFKVIDLNSKYLFPGIIDAHTHYSLHSRGTVTADDFFQGSVSAAAGGVTTIIDYIDFPEDGDFKKAFAERKKEASDSIIDYNFHQVIQDYNPKISKKLKDLKEIALASIKLFTTYKKEGYMIEKKKWPELFRRLKELKILPTVHAESDSLIQDLEKVYKKYQLQNLNYHPAVRPAAAEALAIKEIGEIAQSIELPLYIVHLSSAEGLKAAEELRTKKAAVYLETVPHYLSLDNSYLNKKEAQLYFMTPPLRTKYDIEKLWEALKSDQIQVIATDHCSFTKKEKMAAADFKTVLPGIPGTETLLPLIYTLGVRGGYLTLSKMIELLSVQPAKIFGLYPQKGSFKVGSDADLTVFDSNLSKKLTAKNLHSAANYSPYHDFEVKGYPVMTIRRGEIIFENDLKAEKNSGKFVSAGNSILFDF